MDQVIEIINEQVAAVKQQTTTTYTIGDLLHSMPSVPDLQQQQRDMQRVLDETNETEKVRRAAAAWQQEEIAERIRTLETATKEAQTRAYLQQAEEEQRRRLIFVQQQEAVYALEQKKRWSLHDQLSMRRGDSERVPQSLVISIVETLRKSSALVGIPIWVVIAQAVLKERFVPSDFVIPAALGAPLFNFSAFFERLHLADYNLRFLLQALQQHCVEFVVPEPLASELLVG